MRMVVSEIWRDSLKFSPSPIPEGTALTSASSASWCASASDPCERGDQNESTTTTHDLGRRGGGARGQAARRRRVVSENPFARRRGGLFLPKAVRGQIDHV